MSAVNISAYFDFVHCFIESFFRRAEHLVQRFNSEFVRVKRDALKEVVDLAVLDFDEVLAHGEVEEGGRACVIEVVVLEVVPEAGFDNVVVLNEVFPHDLYVQEPVFELQECRGLILVYALNSGRLALAQFGELAPAGGSQHAVNEVGLRFGVLVGK